MSEIERAIDEIERIQAYFFGGSKNGALNIAIEALRAQQEMENPKPLTPADADNGQWGRCPGCHKLNRYEYHFCANCGIPIRPPKEARP